MTHTRAQRVGEPDEREEAVKILAVDFASLSEEIVANGF